MLEDRLCSSVSLSLNYAQPVSWSLHLCTGAEPPRSSQSQQTLLQMHSDDQVLVRSENERHILLELIEGTL